MPPSNRKKPTRKRQTGPYVGLHMKVEYGSIPPNHFEMVRSLIEKMLCVCDDAKLRRAYRERFGLSDTDPIPSVPTDDLLAEVLNIPLSSIRLGREQGTFPDFYCTRYAGHMDTFRSSLEFWWSPKWGSTWGQMEAFICLNDLPSKQLPELQQLVTFFFERAVASGPATYGYAQIFRCMSRRWNSGGLHFDEPVTLQAMIDLDIRRESGMSFDQHVPAARWVNLLNANHLRALGGMHPFLDELREINGHWGEPGPFWWLELPKQQLLLGISRLNPKLCDGWLLKQGLFLGAASVTGAWLQCRLARASLLACQSEAAFDGIRAHFRGRAERRTEPSRSPQDSSHAIVAEEHGRRQSEFIDRLWKSPPRCIAGGATPLTGSHRSAIARSRGGHGALMTGFSVSRNGASVGIWGRFSQSGEFMAPVAIGGPTEKTAVGYFDERRCGWDAEHGLISPDVEWGATLDRPSGPLDAFHCPRCGHDRFDAIAMFEYGDVDDFADPAVAERPQDFFGWFTLVATCAQCGRKKELVSAECA